MRQIINLIRNRRELAKSKVGHESAVNTFKANRDMYHAIAQKMIAKDVGLN